MYRKNIKWIAAVLAAVLVTGGAATIHAGTVATEKPMAGINLSLDKYSDAVLAEQEKEEYRRRENMEVTAEQVSVKNTSTTVSEETTDSSDKRIEPKKKESHS